MFKICVVGCGSMSSHVHGPVYREYASCSADVELAACCDLDEEKAGRYRDRFGFARSYTDLDMMLDAERPDAVCLVVPEHWTARLSVRIMSKGYPLLMEKPPGLNPAETSAMIAAADQAGVATQVAFNRRYMPLMKLMKQKASADAGARELSALRYDFYRVNRRDADFAATAIHGIDAARHVAGSDFAWLTFHYQSVPGCPAEVVNMEVVGEFESGAQAHLSFRPMSGVLLERATVHTADGHTYFLHLPVEHSIDYPGWLAHYDHGVLVDNWSGARASDNEAVHMTGGFYDENADFFDCLQSGRRPIGDLRSALQSVEIADCLRRRVSSYRKSM